MGLNINPALYTPSDSDTTKSEWKQEIIGRIDQGRVIPVISNAFINDLVFGGHTSLTQRYAEIHIKYPMADRGHDLARMAQWHTVTGADVVAAKKAYLDYLKELMKDAVARSTSISTDKRAELEQRYERLTVTQMCRFLEHPDLDNSHPLILLAGMPFKIYVTTSYHGILEMALEKLKKEPVVEVFPWREDLGVDSVFDTNTSYSPDADHPLVLHLHGIDDIPASLVVTEDDYLDFMTDVISTIKNMPKVETAIRLASLVVLGYRLPRWDFRVLFRIIKALRPPDVLGKSVAVQPPAGQQESPEPEAIRPGDSAPEPQQPEALQPQNGSQEEQQTLTVQLPEADRGPDYLCKYLRQQVRFEVAWADDPGEFIRELYEGWDERRSDG